MKIDFKILRVDILSKFFLKITLIEILNFSCQYSPIILGFQLGNKYFWKISKQRIYSSGKLLMVLQCFYLSQKIKWERALGKLMTSIVKAHLDLDSSGPHRRVEPYESRDMDSPLGQDQKFLQWEQPPYRWGSLLSDIDSSKTMVPHLLLDMKWLNRPLRSQLYSPWAK